MDIKSLKNLDKLIANLRASQRVPKFKIIRQALGLTSVQVARRLGVSRQAVLKLEQAEVSGHITLTKLRELYASIGCELSVIPIPPQSLEEYLKKQAMKAARQHVLEVNTTMGLELQQLTDEQLKEQALAIAEELINRRDKSIWDAS